MKKIVFLSFCFYSLLSYGLQDLKWVNVVGAAYNSTTNVLTNNTYSSWCNARAHSANRLKPNTDGYIEYEIEAVNKQMFLGLTATDNSSCYHHIQFSFHQQYSNFKVYESGAQKYASNGALQIGDIIRIERTGVNVYYKRIRNGVTTLMYTSASSVNPADELFASARLYDNGSSMSFVKTSFDIPMDITASITHIDVDNNIQGAIDITVSGPSAPYTYSWSNGATTEDLSIAHQGIHTVTVTDQFGYSKSHTENIDYMVKWDNISGVSYDEVNNILEKTAPFGWTNAGAVSCNYLSENEPGAITYIVEGTDNRRFIGFWDETITNTNHPDNSYMNYDYCMYQRYNKLHIIEDGVWKAQYYTIAIGDEFRIERDANGNVKYFFKDVSSGVEYTVPRTPPPTTAKLYAGGAMTHTGMKVSKVRYSSPCRVFTNYIKPKKKIDGAIYIPTNNKIFLSFEEYYNTNNGALELKIRNESNQSYVPNNLIAISLGDNRHEIDLTNFSGSITNGIYLLEIINNNKEKRYLRFKI